MFNENEENSTFYDADDNEYRVTLLSEGGQGKVYITEDKKLAVKVAKLPAGADKGYRDVYYKNLEKILSVFVDDNVHIAFPIVGLKDECGYVMEFLDGGKDLTGLMITSVKMSDILTKYNETGGLKRRLLILQDLAKTLHGLHRFGYVYGDLSHANVFISRLPGDIAEIDGNNTVICLIDTDNVKKEVEFKRPIFTPGYGAPEVFMGIPNSAKSDMYSFALLAYRLLNVNGPFDGEEEDDDDDFGWDAETDEGGGADSSKEERGEKAFIFDEEDLSNRAGAGVIPYSFGCTNKLIGLFRRAFSYNSRYFRKDRPTAAEWACALAEATDSLTYCPKCNTHHYYSFQPCGCKFKGVIARIDYLIPADGEYRVVDLGEVVFDGSSAHIFDRKTQKTDLKEHRIFDIKLDGNEFEIAGLNYREYTYSIFTNGKLVEGSSGNIRRSEIFIAKVDTPSEFFARLSFEVKN